MIVNLKRKIAALAVVACLLVNSTLAQEGAHEKGMHYVGPGMALHLNSVGAFGQYDYALHKNWSIGAMFGIEGPNAPLLFLSFRGDIHLGKFIKLPENMDWYGGMHIGPNFLGLTGHFAVHSGFRYFFKGKNIGIQAEGMGGWNMGGLHVSAVWKLGNAKSKA